MHWKSVLRRGMRHAAKRYTRATLCGAGESHLAGIRIPDWQLPRHLALSFIDFKQRMSRHVSTWMLRSFGNYL